MKETKKSNSQGYLIRNEENKETVDNEIDSQSLTKEVECRS